MRRYLKQVFPKVFFSNPAYFRGVVLALVYLTLAILQLFTFEKFADVTADYELAGGIVTAAVLAGIIPFMEAVALPYLLSMHVPVKVRKLSRIAVITVPYIWLAIALWLNVTGKWGINSGLMGATLPTVNGLWLIVFASLLLWACVLVLRELPKRPHSD